MDETGYRIGIGRAIKVITRKVKTRLYSNDPDNREHVTGIKCVNAAGEVLPVCVILKAAHVLKKHIVPGLTRDDLMTVTESGYANNDVHLDWIRYFNARIKKPQVSVNRLLLLDGAIHYLSYNLITYC
jgi:hypothetical protein